jgi:predicted RND superfamily exporter protein
VRLLSDPKATAEALKQLGPSADVSKTLGGGLPSWLDGFAKQISGNTETSTATEQESNEGLARLTTLIKAFDDEVQGDSSAKRLATMANGATKPGQSPREGIDELGYLVGAGDHHVIALFPVIEGDEGYQVTPLIKKIRAARDEAIHDDPSTKVEADVTGVPALVTDELAVVQRDLALTSTLSTIAIALSLYFAFRSIRQASVSFLPIGFGTLITMGMARLVFGKLNLITASFTSVLLGLGDFGVHIQARYAELLRNGVEKRKAMDTALLKAGPGLLVGTFTTAVAFFTTTVTEFTAFAQLGLLTCIGLLVMLCGTYLLIAPMILLILGAKPKAPPEMPGMRALGRFIRRFPKGLVIVSTLITLAFIPLLGGVAFNPRYFDLLPKEAESAKGLLVVEKDRVLTPIVANVTAENIEEARAVTKKLRALDSVATVESPSDLLPELDEASLAGLRATTARLNGPIDWEKLKTGTVTKEDVLPKLTAIDDALDDAAYAMRGVNRDPKAVNETKAALADLKKHVGDLPDGGKERLSGLQHRAADVLQRAVEHAKTVADRGSYLPEDLPPLWQHRFVSKDGKAVALYVHPKDDIWNVKISEHFASEVESATPNASGLAMTLSEHPKMIVRGFQRATALAALLVIIILFLSFRNFRDMAVASVPLVMGAIWMLGIMGPAHLYFNHANMVVLPLLLGLGVDAGVHIMVRYRQSAEEHGGVADIDEMLTSTGGAVVTASLTTIFGFAVMILAKYRGMVTLGIIMSFGMSATLALTLAVVPAILILLKRAR